MTSTWNERVKSWLLPKPGFGDRQRVPAGMYHYQRERDGEYIRFHLRVEPNGESLLIAGASEVARLSRAGTRAAKGLLEATNRDDLVASFKDTAVQQLYREVDSLLSELGSPSSRFPIFNLPDPVDDGRNASLIAPFQADVEVEEPGQLRPILQPLWEAGIPHVRLLPGNAINTQQIVLAVQYAEDIGMIAGVRALACWLSQDDRVKQLAEVGLDYVLLPWGVTDELHREIYGADDLAALPAVLEQIRQWEMTPVIEIPLVVGTVDALSESIQQLTDWRLTHVECFALVAAAEGTFGESATAPLAPAELRQVATLVEELPDEHPLQTIWLPPVACSERDSIREKIRRGPRAGGDVTIRVDASGTVYPPRGKRVGVGNLLQDRWEQIWQNEAFRRFREQVESNTRCDRCPGLAICAADCPSDPVGWAHD